MALGRAGHRGHGKKNAERLRVVTFVLYLGCPQAMVYVHELASTALPKAYAFRGQKEYSAQQAAPLGLCFLSQLRAIYRA